MQSVLPGGDKALDTQDNIIALKNSECGRERDSLNAATDLFESVCPSGRIKQLQLSWNH